MTIVNGVNPDAPTIAVNTTTTDFLDANGALPASGSGAVSGVISDPTDPASTLGIDFTIADSDTAIDSTSVTATSSNTAVVPNNVANLAITGSGTADVNLKITPTGAGYSNITVTVSDGSNTANYVINYAASAASVNPATTLFHTATSDASAAIAIDANYMFVADDEDEVIRLYSRSSSGLPSTGFDFNSTPATTGDAPLGLTEASREVDIEAATRVGNTIYWLGSHSNSSGGSLRPNRYRLFSTTVGGSGVSSTLTFDARYDHLRTDLINWDTSNAHGKGVNFYGLSASAASGVVPESATSNGFSIEGFTVSPIVNTTAYIAFRAPIVPAANRTKALIVPWTNFSSILNATGGAAGSATFGAPIELDLGTRGLRSIECSANGCLIIAGPPDGATGTPPKDFRLYTWDGNPANAPEFRAADLTALSAGGSFEGIVELPDSNFLGANGDSKQVRLLVDNGDTIWYGDSTISKDLPQTNQQKFRSEIIVLGEVTVPPFSINTVTPADGAIGVSPGGNLQVQFNRDIAFGSSGTITLFDAANNVVETFNVTSPGTALSISGNTLTINPTNNLTANTGYYLQIGNGAIQDTSNNPFAGITDTTTWNFTTLTLISQIQGNGTAVTGAGPFTVEAIVVADYQADLGSNMVRGFFIQEEDADADADPATSEGIFVFCNTCATAVNVGDKVQITGAASDYQNLSQMTPTTTTVVNSGNALPAVTTITAPVAATYASKDDYLERFEGMLVKVGGTLTVAENYQLGRFGQVTLAAGGRPTQFTHANTPSSANYTTHLDALARQTIVLDDHTNAQNPDPVIYPQGNLGASNTLRSGSTITDLTGVLHYSWGGHADSPNAWRIRPVTGQSWNYNFTQASRPATAPSVGAANVKVASFNLLNYFNSFTNCLLGVGSTPSSSNCRGAENATEFTRQKDKHKQVFAGLNADVVGLMELENDGYDASSAEQDLLDLVNSAGLVGRSYKMVDADALIGGTNVMGTDAIKVGLIYDDNALDLVAGSVKTSGDAIFDRQPLAATFQHTATGEKFTVVVNHLKSKGSAAGLPGDTDQSDGQGNSNATRVAQAQALVTFLGTLTADPDILVMGDMNAYRMEDPITAIKNAGYTDLLGSSKYSYVYDGQIGYLDHALASASLVPQVSGADDWHIDADEPSVLDYNTNYKSAGQVTSFYSADAYRSSDHDPVLVGLTLGTLVNGACGSANSQTFSSAPTSGLCSTGTPSSVSGSGPWSWTCTGSNGGSTANCSAQLSGGGGGGGEVTDDGDGITDATENGAPNGGDGNGDGFTDSQQGNVTSLPVAGGSGQYLTVQTPTGVRLANVTVQTAGQAGVSGDYPWGVLSFEAFGPSPVTITLFLPGRSTVAGLVLNKIGGGQTQALNATFSIVQIGGQPTVVVSYSLSDNGPHDTCPASGQICDPVGVAEVTEPPEPPVTLTVTKTGSGAVTSVPAGITCGSDCSESYSVGAAVTLTATAASGYDFSGWSGGCAGAAPTCTLTLSANQTVTATFSARAPSLLTVTKTGNGTVSSIPAGINCGSDCSESYPANTAVTLTATAASGYGFTGWSGGCAGTAPTCALILSADQTVTATFSAIASPRAAIGVLRNGQWHLDRSGNSAWDQCGSDGCDAFGQAGDMPVVGNWDGGDRSLLGVLRAGTAQWFLDRNGNGQWDGCGADSCLTFGDIGDLPVAADWSSDGKAKMGVFRAGNWYLDANGNGRWDGCEIDRCYLKAPNQSAPGFGLSGDLPIAGDWNGDSLAKVGVFRAGNWYFDDGNGQWDGCEIDRCHLKNPEQPSAGFGLGGDYPVVGDWNGDGVLKIGVFRNGSWFFDNGNGQWDGCGIDACVLRLPEQPNTGFGLPGDLPAVGRW